MRHRRQQAVLLSLGIVPNVFVRVCALLEDEELLESDTDRNVSSAGRVINLGKISEQNGWYKELCKLTRRPIFCEAVEVFCEELFMDLLEFKDGIAQAKVTSAKPQQL